MAKNLLDEKSEIDMNELSLQERKKVKYLLTIGLIGVLLSMTGDMLLMAFNTTGADGIFGSFLSAANQTSYVRIGFASFFGFIGIPLSGIGFLTLCNLTLEKYQQSKTYKLYKYSTLAFSALGGGVHILCCLILTGLKKNFELGLIGTDAVVATAKELGGALIPCTLVFFIIYGVMVVTQILLIAKHKTYLPGWLAWINPLTLKIVLNLTRNLGSSALANGISCSNMSLGCGIILLFWIVAIRKEIL